jgi:hypothetical protein
MAKGNASSTLSPFRFTPGSPVLAEDFVELVEQGAYSAGYTPETLAGSLCGPPGWNDSTAGSVAGVGGAAPEAQGVVFDPDGNWDEVFSGTFRIPPEAVNLTFGATCRFIGGEDGEVRIKVGGVTEATLVVDDGDNDDVVTDTFTASGVGGAGEYAFTVEIRMTSGAGTDNALNRWWLELEPIATASSWPDPSG